MKWCLGFYMERFTALPVHRQTFQQPVNFVGLLYKPLQKYYANEL